MESEQSFPFSTHEQATLTKGLRALLDIRTGQARLWENARFLAVEVPLNAAAVRKILPFGLRLANPPIATLFVADYTKTAFTIPYREAALLIQVRTLLRRGVHCCWMVVDDDTAQIYGREVLGYPKKLARFRFEEKEQRVSAGVSRRGVDLISVEARVMGREDDPRPVLGTTFNAGGLGQFMAMNPIWSFTPTERIHESFRAEAELRLGDSNVDPIKPLIADTAGKLSARFVVTDIVGARMMFPIGAAGPGWFFNTYSLRYR
jgi:acetoacetate decarboxylase